MTRNHYFYLVQIIALVVIYATIAPAEPGIGSTTSRAYLADRQSDFSRLVIIWLSILA